MALSGLPQARRAATLVRAVSLTGAVRAVVDVEAAGTAHLFAMAGGEVVGSRVAELEAGTRRVRVPTPGGDAVRLLLAFDPDAGPGTRSSAAPVR